MNNARNLEPDIRLKAAAMNLAVGDWVHGLAPWQVISHLTFSWEASMPSAMRCYEKFMRTEMWGVSYKTCVFVKGRWKRFTLIRFAKSGTTSSS